MDITVITEEYVQRSAVNASALANARKVSSKGEFVSRSVTSDKTLIFGDCQGSGKEPYHTSVDVSGESVICRCSCPSRQIPCKHALALMLDYVAGKEFVQGEVPEDVARKREKIEKRAEKAAEKAAGRTGEGTDEMAGILDPEEAAKAAASAAKAAAKKKASADASARKKVNRQLEGLTLVSDFARETLNAGIGTINNATIARYRDLVKQLGDYYLSGPQRLMQSFILAAEADSTGNREQELVQRLVRLDQAAKKGKAWLEKQLESGEFGPQDDVLYEEMGGIWRLEQLDALGLYREDAKLCQLSFHVLWDEAAQAEIDTGYWIDLEDGVISKTENIRPVKAKKYVHADDSAFEVYHVKKLYTYPGGINRRVRWETAVSEPRDASIPGKIVSLAGKEIGAAVKEAKNELKNTLSDGAVAMLIGFDRIVFSAMSNGSRGQAQGTEVGRNTQVQGKLVGKNGETLLLRENGDDEGTLEVLRLLPEKYMENGALLGEFWYSAEDKAIYFAPLTLVTEEEILRLAY